MTRRAPRGRRAAVLLLTALLLGSCSASGATRADRSSTTSRKASPSSTTATTTPPTSPVPNRPYEPKLTAWKSCRGGLECATLPVPLDWDRPQGTRLDLAVARRTMAGAGPRVGSLLFNPGGPAESGVQFLRDIGESTDRFPKGLNGRFDIVSWDTRGSGASAPIRCTTTQEFEEPDLDPTPDTPAEVSALDAKARRDARACIAKAGPLFAHVGTASTARDLEALRQALGDAKLSYVGYSYGTVIGTLYAQRYPTHVRAMVLDGVVIPGGEVIDETHRQAQSFEHNLDAFLADCASRPKCTFGHGNPKGALTKLISDLERGERLPASYSGKDDKGVAHGRAGTLGIGELYPALILPLYSRSTWKVLEEGLADATRTGKPDGFRLLSFRDQQAGRQLDGTWDTSSDGRSAIRCEDTSVRASSVIGVQARATAWGRELPFFGAASAIGLPGCYLFPPAAQPLTPPADGSITTAPIVIVSSTRDPATPYLRGKELQAKIRGSVVLTWDAADHTGYGRQSPCLDAPITKYLIDLAVPRDGLRCRPTGTG